MPNYADELPTWLRAVPRLDEYLGIWAIDARRLQVLSDAVTGSGLRDHVLAARPPALAMPATAADPNAPSVAIIPIEGMMMKAESSFGGASTVAVRRAIRAAAADESVSAILLKIDSPGGTVSGLEDLAADVRAVRGVKPITAFVEDTAASAAYWVAAAADRIVANNSTAEIGSIGVFTVVPDSSGMAAAKGVKIHVVSSGEFKGAGVPGSEITPAQLADFQARIDELSASFVATVAEGRGLSTAQVSAIADGRMFSAERAKTLGLIDGIESLEATLFQLTATRPTRASAHAALLKLKDEETPVSQNQTAELTDDLTPDDILAICPGIDEAADAGWILGQIRAAANADQVTTSWAERLVARITDQNKQLEAAQSAPAAPLGIAPVSTPLADLPAASIAAAAAGGESKHDEFQAAIREYRAANPGRPRKAAVLALENSHPGLREAMLVEVNR